MSREGSYRPDCPVSVSVALMQHRWDLLTFLHWSYEPEVIQALLPDGLVVETYNGKGWVGLVPFSMEVKAGRGPALPWLSHFLETNVRTYVVAEDGTTGVWFFSLEAARLFGVLGGRFGYRLPYFWSKMSLQRSGNDITYSSRRRWPGPRGAHSLLKVRIGDVREPESLTDFEHFLTARFRLYSEKRRGVRAALAAHQPWKLREAEVLEFDDGLVAAAGLPTPDGPPIVHWSQGTSIRVGPPHWV